jgi:3-dehydroquinate dehydratase-2
MKSVLVLNGPNLGQLGSREPEIYGEMNLTALTQMLETLAGQLSISVSVQQSDSESVLMSAIHDATAKGIDVVLNPAAFTHYSYALADACKAHTASGAKLIEVHISNPHAREEFRHYSYLSALAQGIIVGCGVRGYRMAAELILERLKEQA